MRIRMVNFAIWTGTSFSQFMKGTDVNDTFIFVTRMYIFTGVTNAFIFITCVKIALLLLHRGYIFFSVKDRILFHQMNTKCSIFTSGGSHEKNTSFVVHE